MVLNTCRVPLERDESGVIRVEGTRVTLDAVIHAFNEGATAEGIVDRLPAVSLEGIYAAITFYLQNREQVDEYLRKRQIEADHVREQIEARPEYAAFRDRLLARKNGTA